MVTRRWRPTGIEQLCIGQPGKGETPDSLGDLSAVSRNPCSFRHQSLLWILSHKGKRLPGSWFWQLNPFPICRLSSLGSKGGWDVSEKPHSREPSPTFRDQSSQEGPCTCSLRMQPECYIQTRPEYCFQDVFHVIHDISTTSSCSADLTTVCLMWTLVPCKEHGRHSNQPASVPSQCGWVRSTLVRETLTKPFLLCFLLVPHQSAIISIPFLPHQA